MELRILPCADCLLSEGLSPAKSHLSLNRTGSVFSLGLAVSFIDSSPQTTCSAAFRAPFPKWLVCAEILVTSKARTEEKKANQFSQAFSWQVALGNPRLHSSPVEGVKEPEHLFSSVYRPGLAEGLGDASPESRLRSH